MRTRDAVSYVALRSKREGRRGIRGIAYMSVAVTALVAFALLMPALEYQHVEAVRLAEHDLWVSGPMDAADLARLAKTPGADGVAAMLTVTVDGSAGPRTDPDRSRTLGAVTAWVYDDATDLARGPYPEGLLVSGSVPEQGEWACDWQTAKRLRLRPGDTVSAVVSLPTTTVTMSGTLAGIYGPSGPARDSIAVPASRDLVDAVADAGGARWSDAFLTSDDPVGLALSTASGPDADRLLALPRIALEEEARGRLTREVGPFLRSGATLTALAALLAISLWQQSARLARRRREYAVLSALGVSPSGIARLDAFEHAAHVVAAGVAGSAAALLLLQELNSTFVPRAALAQAALAVAGAGALAVLVAVGSIAAGLRRRSLADALAEGGGR